MLDENNSIYHEKQSLELCAMHALNNLFQGVAFTKDVMDAICKRLCPDSPWLNPHKSWVGLGNYDVNVVMSALNSKDCCAIWFDKRKDPKNIKLESIVGFILNVPSEPKVGPLTISFLKRRHWIAVREIGGVYYNLDSKLVEPAVIGTEAQLIQFLKQALARKDKEVFVVVSRGAEEAKSYLKLPQ